MYLSHAIEFQSAVHGNLHGRTSTARFKSLPPPGMTMAFQLVRLPITQPGFMLANLHQSTECVIVLREVALDTRQPRMSVREGFVGRTAP